MRRTGILRSWNDERGFGFIAPTHGGAELFVHISALPRDGSRPVVGESVTYELGRGPNGKPQAVKVVRAAVGMRPPSVRPLGRRTHSGNPLKTVVLAAVVVAGIALAYQHATRPMPASPRGVAAPAAAAMPEAVHSTFRCDGRIHCSQMTSCAEATFFLRNCPGVKMDGDHDGVPCEQQWCN